MIKWKINFSQSSRRTQRKGDDEVMILYRENAQYKEFQFKKEEDFENEIVQNSALFFGNRTIYIDAKKKIESKSLGNTIPDGFLIDLTDVGNPDFYIIEVELSSHDFYKHIFPQITKFFAFFKNTEKRKELIEKIYSIINMDSKLKKNFQKLINDKEIYKYINDVIENSQNILLILDEEKIELPEIMDTYTDTWGKIVKLQIIKKFTNNNDAIFTMQPEFESIEYSTLKSIEDVENSKVEITEEFHLDGVQDVIKDIYFQLKKKLMVINDSIIFNPQKYYISIVNKKNVAYFIFSKKKIRLVVMRPLEDYSESIKVNKISTLSESVQKFYGAPCGSIYIDNIKGIDEIISVLNPLIHMEEDE